METDLEEELQLNACEKRKRANALKRVVEIWLDYEHDPEELDIALDLLTLVHTKADFDLFNQYFYFRLPRDRIRNGPKVESDQSKIDA